MWGTNSNENLKNHSAMLLPLHLLCALAGGALAANFSVIVNGTASHAVPETLCTPSFDVSTISTLSFYFSWFHVRGNVQCVNVYPLLY